MSNSMEIFKGDNGTWQVTVNDQDGVPVDITNALIVFTVKKNVSDTNILIQRKNALAGGDDTQIEMFDPANGIFKLHLVPSNTSGLSSGKGVFDFQVTLSSKVYTIIKDKFNIKEDVTK